MGRLLPVPGGTNVTAFGSTYDWTPATDDAVNAVVAAIADRAAAIADRAAAIAAEEPGRSP